jgi:hypothetical protein
MYFVINLRQMSHLAVQISDYLATSQSSARQLEDSSGLPRMTIGNILKDAHPRPERFGQLLRAVDDATARRWLTAYLRDDCPPNYLPRLEITIKALEGSTSDTLAEAITPYTTETSPAAVLDAWHRLQTAIQSDTSLARWFVKTILLILGPA